MIDDYSQFLAGKQLFDAPSGFDVEPSNISHTLFPFQRDVVRWSLARGRAGLFLDTGLGKTAILLEWAQHVVTHTGGNVLILAPLAVSHQIAREGTKFGVDVRVCKTQADMRQGINVTNYERLHHFDASAFVGIVLDEASILKSRDGRTRTQMIDMFARTPYRLICTATPSPNDYMELGSYAEFLGIMRYTEMLATWFTHDGGDTSKWKLMGHATERFWEWLSSWAVAMRRPSDLGYDNGAYNLPEKRRHAVIVDAPAPTTGHMFAMEARTMTERRAARKDTLENRVAACAEIVNALPLDEQVIIWCNLNAESEMLTRAIHGAIEVTGGDSDEHKERVLIGFADGAIKRLVSKPSICGFGMNWQGCHYMAFVGLSDSFESMYQAERRCWRFGQTNTVDIWIITSETEGAVVRNIEAKEARHHHMMNNLIEYMAVNSTNAIHKAAREGVDYQPLLTMVLPKWLISERA